MDRDLDRTIAEVVHEILRSPDGPGELPALVSELRAVDAADRVRAAKKLGEIGPQGRAAAPGWGRHWPTPMPTLPDGD